MLLGGYTSDSQQRPEGNWGVRSNTTTDEKTETQMVHLLSSIRTTAGWKDF